MGPSCVPIFTTLLCQLDLALFCDDCEERNEDLVAENGSGGSGHGWALCELVEWSIVWPHWYDRYSLANNPALLVKHTPCKAVGLSGQIKV
jgi:hypothetical protein